MSEITATKEQQNKYEALKEYLRSLGSVAVAFSSGVDSTFLLKTAHDVLGDKCIAITAMSCSFPKRELEEAKAFCEKEGIRHITVESEELEIEGFCQNPANRCYICKKELFEKIWDIARKEGLLQLETAADEIDDDFLKKGIMLIVDGTDQELVSSILETELECIEKRHNKKISFWDNLAAMGPAWGMIGTLIGLINMLKLLDDPSSIGPNMAVALITTMYGSLLANWISIPIATKLRANNRKEIAVKEIVCEGILSIQAGENPRVIEEKLKSFLAPADRNKLMDNGEQGGEA